MTFYVPIGCIRFARYCGKMYSCHLFPYGGFKTKWHWETFNFERFVLANALSCVLSCGGGSPPPPCSRSECRNEWSDDWSPGIPTGQCVEQTRRAHQTQFNSHQGSGSCPTPVPCNPLSLQYRLACK